MYHTVKGLSSTFFKKKDTKLGNQVITKKKSPFSRPFLTEYTEYTLESIL